ncbi:MAG: polysaccharide deacetylase family protein [Chitinophagaceae bacterium]|nr:polysaccharide deacetylase family protein [Chitinophagaceae bacterium]
MYFFKTPFWLKLLYPKRTWAISTSEKIIYLTFDDGPHPQITPFVLDLLKQYEAKASFFCIGHNVERYPLVYDRILADGHSTGNHTYDHKNGFKTNDEEYLNDLRKAETWIRSKLFRPPYGRLKWSQARKLKDYRIIMWDLLSGDFDTGLKKEKCLEMVKKHARPGSILVFHDSEKAWERLEYVLPNMLAYFKQQGYRFEKIRQEPS